MTQPAPPPPLGERPRLPAVGLLWALGCLAGGDLVGTLLASVVASITGSTTGAAVTLVGELGLWSGMVAAAVVVSRRFATGNVRADFAYGVGRRDVWPGIGAALGGVAVWALAGSVFSGTRFAGSNTQVLTGQRHNGVSFAVISVIVAVGAPLFEELFFRGVVRGSLEGVLGSHGAVWGQAVLFGLAHFEVGNGLGNVSIMLILGGLGVVLGYTARATGRLGPGIIAHGLFNTLSVVTIIAT